MRHVRILVFVYENITKLVLIFFEHIAAVSEKLQRHTDKVVKIERIRSAEALFILSNDSWYGEAGSSILVRNSVLRAVETGRYTVRSASTGISAFISPTGVIYDSLATGEEGYITESIGMRSADTVYFAAGRFFPVLCGVFLLSGAVLNAVLFYRERKIRRD